jgi:4-hydroxy-2-oxoglutarate aldolase
MHLSGLFAPLPTPFDDQDHVDILRLRAAFPRWLATPLDGFVVLGSNGEAALMDDDECDRVVDAARSLVPDSRVLIVGTGRESTRAAVAATQRAASLGADAVLVRTPSFFRSQMTSDVFVRHYLAVADTSPVPVLLYNFTAVTGVNLQPATVARLAEHPNIVGVKESGSDISQLADLVNLTPPSFSVLAGSASTFYSALAAGVSGGILALAALLPSPCVRLFELMRNNQYEDARALQRQLLPVARLISTGHGVPGLKAALSLIGIDVGRPRPPLVPLDESAVAALRAALARFEEVIV